MTPPTHCFVLKFPDDPVGAAICRPVILEQNHIASGDNSVISFGNPNPCDAMIGRAANSRPYGILEASGSQSVFGGVMT